MKILKNAVAGSLESNDIFITFLPKETGGIEVELKSIVEKQFGDQIIASIKEVAEKFGVRSAIIQANDRGALDYTIRARVETAIRRAGRESEI